MSFHSKIINSIKKLYNIERLVIFLLAVIMIAQFFGAFFVFKKLNILEKNLKDITRIYHNLNNGQAKQKDQLSQLQSLMVRLQALLYRQEGEKEENNDE